VLYNLETAEELCELRGNASAIVDVVFSQVGGERECLLGWVSRPGCNMLACGSTPGAFKRADVGDYNTSTTRATMYVD
jgi:hypothetical protein